MTRVDQRLLILNINNIKKQTDFCIMTSLLASARSRHCFRFEPGFCLCPVIISFCHKAHRHIVTIYRTKYEHYPIKRSRDIRQSEPGA